MYNSRNITVNYKQRIFFFFTLFSLYTLFECVSFLLYSLADCTGALGSGVYCKTGFDFVENIAMAAEAGMFFLPLALLSLFMGIYNLFKYYKEPKIQAPL